MGKQTALFLCWTGGIISFILLFSVQYRISSLFLDLWFSSFFSSPDNVHNQGWDEWLCIFWWHEIFWNMMLVAVIHFEELMVCRVLQIWRPQGKLLATWVQCIKSSISLFRFALSPVLFTLLSVRMLVKWISCLHLVSLGSWHEYLALCRRVWMPSLM